MFDDKKIQAQRKADRINEMKKESIVSSITDSVLRQCGLYPIRTTSVDFQVSGIDFFLNTPSERMLVDEKSANTCWNRDLQTYTIEVINKCNNNDSGWTANGIAQTTHYLLVWIRATDETLSDIWRWEGMLVEKRLIHDLLESFGYTNLELEKLVTEKGSKAGRYGLCYTLYVDERADAKERVNVFLASSHLEKNVNVQLPKSWFEQFAIKHIIWTKGDGIVLNESKPANISPKIRKACINIRLNKDRQQTAAC